MPGAGATPDRLDLPARRRRSARLIAALTQLIGVCAEEADAVCQPIAAATPGQEAVETGGSDPHRGTAPDTAAASPH
ncbi:hypothetical protein [Streptomyces achromogenes]|uniref:hypothetical protein n=1 Tax=Streptomyces achromogenes TaxID=67255 RepID=UPI00367985C3